jgi:hypothetical protein
VKRWLPVILAAGISIGVIVGYLLAGGGTYKPLAVADPCEPRSEAVLAQRGVFEGILLSGLDGAACELGVSREELASAFADAETLDEFAASRGLDPERIEEAVRAGLVRAVDDAEAQGRLPGAIASIARAIAENAPVTEVISLFESIPGDPSLADVLEAASDAGLALESFGDAAIGEIEDAFGGLDLTLPEGLDPSQILPEDPSELLPEGLDPQRLEEDIQGLEDDIQGLEDFIP